MAEKGFFKLPFIPEFATNNSHIFYIILDSLHRRSELINYLKEKSIISVFHYLSLHKSYYYRDKYFGSQLINSDKYEDCLLRLPMFYELNTANVIPEISQYYFKKN